MDPRRGTVSLRRVRHVAPRSVFTRSNGAVMASRITLSNALWGNSITSGIFSISCIGYVDHELDDWLDGLLEIDVLDHELDDWLLLD